jgi:hypothetical protein
LSGSGGVYLLIFNIFHFPHELENNLLISDLILIPLVELVIDALTDLIVDGELDIGSVTEVEVSQCSDD